jgi:hypothetical protein
LQALLLALLCAVFDFAMAMQWMVSADAEP